jgi:WD40 repeat protein
VKHHTDTECMELQADVSSVHWSHDGSRLVTSSNDMMARIWRFDDESGHFEIESVKSFNVMLMNSKFNKPSQSDTTQLVATGVTLAW